MGYVRGRKIKDEMAFAPFKIYVRFVPDVPPLAIPPVVMDGEDVEVRETASTLYDSLLSKALDRFIDDMRTRKITSLDLKKLAMVGVIGAAAVAGILLILMR